MTGTCQHCGKPMPYRRKDGTAMKRTFCSRACSQQSAKPRIPINGDGATVPSAGSWWAETPREAWQEKYLDRTKALSPRYGSAPMATIGPIEPGYAERARRAKRQEGDGA